MSRIAIPSRETAPAASRPLVEAVTKQLGSAPDPVRLLATSPAALEGQSSVAATDVDFPLVAHGAR